MSGLKFLSRATKFQIPNSFRLPRLPRSTSQFSKKKKKKAGLPGLSTE